MLYGLIAYGLWGAFPLYFSLLDGIPPIEIVAHRVIWSLVFLAIVLTVTRGWRATKVSLNPRVLWLLAAGAVVLSINWGTYVYAVQENLVVEASLGYFINPLVSVALGVLFLGERLRPAQWSAVGVALVAVAVLTVTLGHPPWISLALAFSFGSYALFKKQAGIGALGSLTVETTVLLPVALAIVVAAQLAGTATLGHTDWSMTMLLILLGPVTATPLVAFGAAATRLPLSVIGIMEYVTPVLQFILGLVVFHEAMSTGRWLGFVLVWIALVIFTVDTVRASRQRQPVSTLVVAEPD